MFKLLQTNGFQHTLNSMFATTIDQRPLWRLPFGFIAQDWA